MTYRETYYSIIDRRKLRGERWSAFYKRGDIASQVCYEVIEEDGVKVTNIYELVCQIKEGTPSGHIPE